MLGLSAGYGPRWLDNALLLLFDSVYSFPTVILGPHGHDPARPQCRDACAGRGRADPDNRPTARLVRTATLATKNSEYVLAIRSIGHRRSGYCIVHILPNIVGPLFIIASMDIPAVITLEAGLTYLGMGIPPPAPSRGRILQEGFESDPGRALDRGGGGIPLIITTLGFTLLGKSLRDWLDPKLRRIV